MDNTKRHFLKRKLNTKTDTSKKEFPKPSFEDEDDEEEYKNSTLNPLDDDEEMLLQFIATITGDVPAVGTDHK